MSESSAGESFSSSSSSSGIFPLIVQSTKFQDASLGNTIPFVLTSSAIVGNILLAFTQANQFGQTRNTTPPDSSWHNIDTIKYINYIGMDVWWKLVVDGDGANYTFNVSGTNEYRSGILYELRDIDTESPINQHAIKGIPAATVNIFPELITRLLLIVKFVFSVTPLTLSIVKLSDISFKKQFISIDCAEAPA